MSEPLLSHEAIVSSAIRHDDAMYSGVYFLLQGNEIVYVGQSKNVFARLHWHRTTRRMHFDRWWFQPCPERLLLRLEAHYIALFDPRCNVDSRYVEQFSEADLLELAEVQL